MLKRLLFSALVTAAGVTNLVPVVWLIPSQGGVAENL